MPIQLTTPKATGDLDPAAPSSQYSQAKIVNFNVNLREQAITIDVQYGNTVDDLWVPGIVPTTSFRIVDKPEITAAVLVGEVIEQQVVQAADPQYSTLVATMPSGLDVTIYNQVALNLYGWLAANTSFVGDLV